jgi:hypothetical protein
MLNVNFPLRSIFRYRNAIVSWKLDCPCWPLAARFGLLAGLRGVGVRAGAGVALVAAERRSPSAVVC